MYFKLIIIALAVLILLVIIMFIYMARIMSIKEKLKPIQFLTYGRNRFNRTFNFPCEYCGYIVSTEDGNCPNCSGEYKSNRKYKEVKREVDIKYIEFLKHQEDLIKQEVKYIESMFKLRNKSFLIKPNFFNFNLQEIPKLNKSNSFEFSCEYCGTKLRGKSNDSGVCYNCMGSYHDNVELLVQEEEENLQKEHYIEYTILQDIQWNANIDNNVKTWAHNKFWVDSIGKWLIAGIIILIIYIIPTIIYIVIRLLSW